MSLFDAVTRKRPYAAISQPTEYSQMGMSRMAPPRPSGQTYRTFRKKRVSKSKGLATKTFVERAIARSEEVKRSQYYAENVNVAAYGTTSGGLTLPVSPLGGVLTIAQGTSQGQRIGNRIKVQKAHLRMDFSPNNYNATSNAVPVPQLVLVWLYYDASNVTAVSSPDSTFLQDGGSTKALVGKAIDMISPVNTDRWKVFKKFVLKIGFASNSGTGAAANSAYYANNGFVVADTLDIDCTSMLPKYIQFNDNSTTPTSRNLLMYAESVNFNGSVQSAASLPLAAQVVLDFHFTDA